MTYIPESGTNKWTALWYPRSRSDVIPLRQIAGVQYDIDRKTRPAFAMRWDYSVDGLDVGASYFSGLDHMPDLSLQSLSPTGATLQLKITLCLSMGLISVITITISYGAVKLHIQRLTQMAAKILSIRKII